MVLSTVVPTSFTAVDSLEKKRFRLIAGHLRLSLQGTDTGGEEWCLGIWFDCSALNWDCGLVDCVTNIVHGCWLFGQNKIQVYCRASSTNVVGNRLKGEEWHLGIWFDCSALNWDRGLVGCGTNILHGYWLFGKNKIQVYSGASSTIVVGNRHRRGRVTSWHLIFLLSIKLGLWSCQLWYQHPSRLLTLRTKRDSGLLWGIVDYCCGEQTQGEKSDVLTFDLFAQH